MPAPLVSVLMAVHNTASYLAAAVDSILQQTFTDFELILIDDASADDTPSVLDQYSDPRLVRLQNDVNQGLAASLNRGLDTARGSLIARMDGDDISAASRFEKQVAYLQTHPEIGVVGTNFQVLDETGAFDRGTFVPLSRGVIHWHLFFGNPLVHPSVMMRRELLEQVGGYDPQRRVAQDFELWLRMARITYFANLAEPLLQYRLRHTSTTLKNLEQGERIIQDLVQEYVGEWLGRPVTSSIAAALRGIALFPAAQRPAEVAVIRDAAEALRQLYQRYVAAVDLRPDEAKAVRQDVAFKLLLLAGCAARRSMPLSASLGLAGITMSPAALSQMGQLVSKKLRRQLVQHP